MTVHQAEGVEAGWMLAVARPLLSLQLNNIELKGAIRACGAREGERQVNISGGDRRPLSLSS